MCVLVGAKCGLVISCCSLRCSSGLLLAACCIMLRFEVPMHASLMKQYTEDQEQKQQGNKQPLLYSGIKNIVKSSTSGESPPPIGALRPVLPIPISGDPSSCAFKISFLIF